MIGLSKKLIAAPPPPECTDWKQGITATTTFNTSRTAYLFKGLSWRRESVAIVSHRVVGHDQSRSIRVISVAASRQTPEDMSPILYSGLDSGAQSHSLGDCIAYGFWTMFMVDVCTAGMDGAGTMRDDLRGHVQAFPSEITEQLGYYVYRLIDPRNGETFYVGKGRGNRVFHHVSANLKQAELADDEDELTTRMRRVREILSEGLQVIHVIQRHGLTEREAFHVEGALIDAFPGLTNVQSGHGNSDKGAMHADAIVRKYAAQRLEPDHRIVFLTIRRNFLAERGPYEGCRGVWRMSRSRAERAELVMPVTDGVVVGVFVPERWIDATVENFKSHITEDVPGRIGFDGHPAEEAIRDLYIGKRLPANLETGTQNPVRYSYS